MKGASNRTEARLLQVVFSKTAASSPRSIYHNDTDHLPSGLNEEDLSVPLAHAQTLHTLA